MLNVKFTGIDPIGEFNELFETIGSKVYEEKSLSSTQLNDSYGEGIIAITKISKNISNLCFDVTFNNDFEICLSGNLNHSVDFVYCLEGSVIHKFQNNSNSEHIDFRQNAIISRITKSKSILKFPSNVPLRISIISYSVDSPSNTIDDYEIDVIQEKALRLLPSTFFDDRYRYFGRICFKTAVYAKEAIAHSFQSPSEILFKEAAILNILASQIERYNEDTESNHIDAPIKKSEIDKVIALDHFIKNNLSEELSVNRLVSLSGLNAAKLQNGFQYLFENTISNHIRDKRLDKAVSLIKDTDYNVSELVYSVGFSSRSYFSKIFKLRYGVLPSQCVSNPNLLMAI